MKRILSIILFIIIIITSGIILLKSNKAFIKKQAPNLSDLNKTIISAEKYYDRLYKDLGNNGAIITEFYSYPKSTYTIRHATIGGIYYYEYIGDNKKADQLKRFVSKYGFKLNEDEHSFIWTKTNNADLGIVYSPQTYHDCFVKLPAFGNILPYHSKVCKIGMIGLNAYIVTTMFDTFVPMVNILQELEQHQVVNMDQVHSFENKFNNLGFGMPMCSPLGCANSASTIRTAQFGELEMRLGNMQYADAVANDLLKAQDSNGAIYLSYNEKGQLNESRPWIYELLDSFLNDAPIYHGYIPTNAESMNDSLAFLLHYRCQKYKVCK